MQSLLSDNKLVENNGKLNGNGSLFYRSSSAHQALLPKEEDQPKSSIPEQKKEEETTPPNQIENVKTKEEIQN